MKIGIDARFIQDEYIGIGRYSHSLLKAMAEVDRENEYVVYKNPACRGRIVEGENFREVAVASAPISAGTLFSLGRRLRADGLDLFHSHFYITPLAKPCMQVVTIHDITPLLFPKYYSGRNYVLEQLALWFHKALIPRTIRRSDRIIAVSEFTKKCILEAVPRRDAGTIDVIYEGTEPHFRPPANAAEIERVRAAAGLPERYFIYVGNTKPHKNLDGLAKAFSALLDSSPRYRDIRLIIAGKQDRFFPALRERVASLDHGEKVIFPGYVGEAELSAFYAGALALVFPGLLEGFGLPVLEAMACGAPVIASNASSIPEVTGEAAILVDPRDTGRIAEAMARVADDGALRDRMASQSLDRAATFSWRKAALETISVYEKVAGGV